MAKGIIKWLCMVAMALIVGLAGVSAQRSIDKNGTGRYFLTSGAFTWLEAYEDCMLNGGRLAQPLSPTRLREMFKTVRKADLRYAWTGLYQNVQATTTLRGWRYISGLDFKGLYQAEPEVARAIFTFAEPDDGDETFTENHQQDCGLLNGDASINDFACSQNNFGICEPAQCGVFDKPCCGSSLCDAGMVCDGGKCAFPECGSPGFKCCTGSAFPCANLPELGCRSGICQPCTQQDGYTISEFGNCLEPGVDMDPVEATPLAMAPGPSSEASNTTGEAREIIMFGDGSIVAGQDADAPTSFPTTSTEEEATPEDVGVLDDISEESPPPLLTFPQAYDFCIGDGKRLPQPRTQAGLDALRIIQTNFSAAPSTGVWLGAFQAVNAANTSSDWFFGDGTAVPEAVWLSGDPDDINEFEFYTQTEGYPKEFGARQCAKLTRSTGPQYNSTTCLKQQFAICTTGECGLLKQECCPGDTCDFGLECGANGKCKPGCGMPGAQCCKTGEFECLPGTGCVDGTCTECSDLKNSILFEGKCIKSPYSFVSGRQLNWPLAYGFCARAGRRLATVDSTRQLELLSIYHQFNLLSSIHLNTPDYVAEDGDSYLEYLKNSEVQPLTIETEDLPYGQLESISAAPLDSDDYIKLTFDNQQEILATTQLADLQQTLSILQEAIALEESAQELLQNQTRGFNLNSTVAPNSTFVTQDTGLGEDGNRKLLQLTEEERQERREERQAARQAERQAARQGAAPANLTTDEPTAGPTEITPPTPAVAEAVNASINGTEILVPVVETPSVEELLSVPRAPVNLDGPAAPIESLGTEYFSVTSLSQPGVHLCLNGGNLALCADVHDVVCETGTCGTDGGQCCPGNKCDYGMECVKGECKLSCGIPALSCCKSGPPCLDGLACFEGSCQTCPNGYIQQNQECQATGYSLTNRTATWAQVYTDCVRDGYALATPVTKEERAAMQRFLTNTRTRPQIARGATEDRDPLHFIFVGASQADDAKTWNSSWTWIDGREIPVGYSGWYSIQPGDYESDEEVGGEYGRVTYGIDPFVQLDVTGNPALIESVLTTERNIAVVEELIAGVESGLQNCMTVNTKAESGKLKFNSKRCSSIRFGICEAADCGVLNKKCCAKDKCIKGLTCVNGKCKDGCGLNGSKCCPGQDKCLGDLVCQDGTCGLCDAVRGFALKDGKCVQRTGDMIVDVDLLDPSNLALQQIDAGLDPCLKLENCLGATEGIRWVLRFGSQIKNIGDGDVVLGGEPQCPTDFNDLPVRDGAYFFDKCHWHWHFEGYAEYVLDVLDEAGQVTQTIEGRKTGFCLLDGGCFFGNVGKYVCTDQGISKGCYDVYGSGLNCQWIDVTDFVDDQTSLFRLSISINTGRDIKEENYENNVGQITFRMPDVPLAAGFGEEYIVDELCPTVDNQGNIAPLLLGSQSSIVSTTTSRKLKVDPPVEHTEAFTREQKQSKANSAEWKDRLTCPKDPHVPGCILPEQSQKDES